MRPPAVAGQFYPGTRESLSRAVDECFLSSHGPGALRLELDGHPRFGVAPHAGYVFSGPTAARTVAALAPSMNGSVILVGPDHTGYAGPADVSLEDFATPAGTARNDRELSKKLISGGLDHGERAHRYEHSLEVQLPLLLRVKPDCAISPVLVGDQSWENVERVAGIISDVMGDDDVLLASSDFTHCGVNYGQPVPHGWDAGRYARERDAPALDLAVKLDPERFLRHVRTEELTVCGAGPVAVAMAVARSKGASSGVLLEYITSYDISPGPMAVGYASLVFV